MTNQISPDILLKAYCCGVFPMGEDAGDPELFWVDPQRRGVLPLEGCHFPKRLLRKVRRDAFQVRVDSAFPAVMQACATPAPGRDKTWINEPILDLYGSLFNDGFAHSVECWLDGELVGGLYGVSIGAAFFGESMFHTVTDASKVALAHLVARLRAGGYTLLDTQFVTDHLRQFGALEISRADYHRQLRRALAGNGDFYGLPVDADGAAVVAVLQSITQTS